MRVCSTHVQRPCTYVRVVMIIVLTRHVRLRLPCAYQNANETHCLTFEFSNDDRIPHNIFRFSKFYFHPERAFAYLRSINPHDTLGSPRIQGNALFSKFTFFFLLRFFVYKSVFLSPRISLSKYLYQSISHVGRFRLVLEKPI